MQSPKHPRRRHWQMHCGLEGKIMLQRKLQWNGTHKVVQCSIASWDDYSSRALSPICHLITIALVNKMMTDWTRTRVNCTVLYPTLDCATQCSMLQKMTNAKIDSRKLHRNPSHYNALHHTTSYSSYCTTSYYIALHHSALQCIWEDDQRYKCKIAVAYVWCLPATVFSAIGHFVTIYHMSNYPHHRHHSCHYQCHHGCPCSQSILKAEIKRQIEYICWFERTKCCSAIIDFLLKCFLGDLFGLLSWLAACIWLNNDQ